MWYVTTVQTIVNIIVDSQTLDQPNLQKLSLNSPVLVIIPTGEVGYTPNN